MKAGDRARSDGASCGPPGPMELGYMNLTGDEHRDRALADLRWHWDTAYEISEVLGVWRAVRLDNGRTVIAGDPEELRALIIRDYTRDPVRT
jgi:hypothetical protein